MLQRLIWIIAAFFVVSAVHAQGLEVTGRITDAADNSPIIGADVMLLQKNDSNVRKVHMTDTAGRFFFSGMTQGSYILRVHFIGYSSVNMPVSLNQDMTDLGTIKITVSGLKLKEVDIKSHQVRADQNGDTTSYHADAFKTNKDASAEDLVTKLPGVTVNNGTVTAHGEQVQQVLVDGKPFYGDDPAAALKNLPAEVIDKIQVFDKKSDQAQFTGFDDGQTQKTMNIVTKKNKRNGLFGKASAGYGTDDRYAASLNMNLFNGNRRISVLGMSNNINQQNFSTQDLLGVMGSSGQRGGFGGGRTGASIGGPNMMFLGGGSSNFLVGQQGGINNTNSAGINYSDSLGSKVYLTGSYFFNKTVNTTQNTLARTYFTSNKINPVYNENDFSTSPNLNHRINFRLEYKMDTNNDIIFTPRLSTQRNISNSSSEGINSIPPDTILSRTSNNYYSKSTGYNFAGNVLARHRFLKRGRTLSVNVGTTINNKTGGDTLQYANTYYRLGQMARDSVEKQHTNSPTESYSASANLNYTEPLGKTGQLQLDYAPTITRSVSEKETYYYDSLLRDYTILNSALSSNYNNTSITNREGLSYRNRMKSLDYMLGVHYQSTMLDGAQVFPYAFAVNKTFNSILPNVMLNEKFTKTSSLRIFYNTSTTIPTISQLQNVINNTNPLVLSTGNPELGQQYSNNLTFRFAKANIKAGRNFFAFLTGTQTSNYITNKTIFAYRDSILDNGIRLPKGSQFTQPVNLDNYWSLRSFLGYGIPVDFIKCNLNINGGVSYTSAPGLVNGNLNYANTTNLNPGIVLSSNISEKIDFTVSYTAGYNIVKNTVQRQSNQNYYSQTSMAKFNWVLYKGFTYATDITHILYTGLGSYNQSYFLWNMSVGKKVFKDQNGEIKLYVYDLLNQNINISRTVSPAYIDDMRTQVLRQYFMLSFTYTLRNFTPEPDPKEHKRMFPPMPGFTPGQPH